jgi:hypothetical protein
MPHIVMAGCKGLRVLRPLLRVFDMSLFPTAVWAPNTLHEKSAADRRLERKPCIVTQDYQEICWTNLQRAVPEPISKSRLCRGRGLQLHVPATELMAWVYM